MLGTSRFPLLIPWFVCSAPCQRSTLLGWLFPPAPNDVEGLALVTGDCGYGEGRQGGRGLASTAIPIPYTPL